MPKDPQAHNFVPPEIEEIAKLLPGYEIKEFVAKGGMGAVYRARQKSLDREVAIKILPGHFVQDAGLRAQFESEAKSMAKLNHPNVISVYNFGECDGQPFIVMEMVPGKSLYHSAYGIQVEPRQAGRIIHDICLGLAHAHQHGILHRDLKPANILLNPDRMPKIGDFGLARHITDHQSDKGYWTPGYTAPEVAQDPEAVNESTDLYSVGIMLYELIAGERPEDPYVPVATRVECDPAFDQIILKAIDPSPANRYSSAKDMAEAIDEVIKPGVSSKDTRDKKIDASAPRKLLVPEALPEHAERGQVHLRGYQQGMQPRTASSPRRLIRNVVISILILLGIHYAWEKGWLDPDDQKAAKAKENEAAGHKGSESKQQAKKSSADHLSKVWHGSNQPTHQKGTSSSEQDLPEGKLSFGDSEYQLIRKPMTWHQARDHCEQLGGHLAIVTSKEESDFVARLASGNDAWLGATDAHKEGDWRWLDGTELLYKHWQDGQPDDWQNEDCLEIRNVYGNKWNDRTGEALHWFVCEWSSALDQHYALKKRAEGGDLVAQRNFAFSLKQGRGIALDRKEAIKWFRKGAERGDAACATALGWEYHTGNEVLARNLNEAIKWFRMGANAGDGGAQFALGLYYSSGIGGVVKDDNEAVKWWRKGAEQGISNAQYYLADAFFHGRGVQKNLEQALSLFQKVADNQNDVWGKKESRQKLPQVQYELGESDYEKENYKKAVEWYQISALQGNADAQFKLAQCYYYGKGVKKDRDKARDLLRQAAGQGHEQARKAFFKL